MRHTAQLQASKDSVAASRATGGGKFSLKWDVMGGIWKGAKDAATHGLRQDVHDASFDKFSFDTVPETPLNPLFSRSRSIFTLPLIPPGHRTSRMINV